MRTEVIGSAIFGIAYPDLPIHYETVADPEFYNRGGEDCWAPKFEFLPEKGGFSGAFWDDFLRSERHKKRHTRPAVNMKLPWHNAVI